MEKAGRLYRLVNGKRYIDSTRENIGLGEIKVAIAIMLDFVIFAENKYPPEE